MSDRMLSGRKALVTGSTGIGLGIARQLAAQGADIRLNGFGDEATIREMVAGTAKEHDVAVTFEGGDLTLVQKQIDARASENRIPVDEAKRALLGEKQPSLEFVTPAQLGALAVFLCSPDADEVRGAAWNRDGGWVAQ